MLILMHRNHTRKQREKVLQLIGHMGFKAHVIPGSQETAIGITGNHGPLEPRLFDGLPGVDRAIPVTKSYKLAGRDFHPRDTVIDVGGFKVGGGRFLVIAGPCAVESEEQTLRIAKAVKKAGAHMLRGGAFKPRTSPYSFQGLGLQGLKILQSVKRETGLAIVTEALDQHTLEEVCEYADVIQIGARNMQNFALLRDVGRLNKPVMLKRGLSATLEEWLMSAEYILSQGNSNLFLCERGVRAYMDHSRNTLDLNVVPAIKELSHLPIIVDPSHGTGSRSRVAVMAKASAAAGAHGIMVEVHDQPEKALCDGPQALKPAEFQDLMTDLKNLAKPLHYAL